MVSVLVSKEVYRVFIATDEPTVYRFRDKNANL
jgi:hypothetical protein